MLTKWAKIKLKVPKEQIYELERLVGNNIINQVEDLAAEYHSLLSIRNEYLNINNEDEYFKSLQNDSFQIKITIQNITF